MTDYTNKLVDENPMFSIIIPTLNSALSIKKCLESVISQNFKDFEIVIVDCLSTDNTVAIINSYKSEYDKIKITSEKDEGIYDSMNKGIDKAMGKWLYFLGSDDSLYDDQVLACVNSCVSSKPSTNLIFGDVHTSLGVTQRYNRVHYYELCKLNICHQAIFYRSSLFKNQRYDLKYPICADWDLNLKLFNRKNRPFYLGKTIANYNLNGKSNDWINSADYRNYFQDSHQMVLRYRGGLFLCIFLVKKSYKTIREFLIKKWRFQ